MKKDIYETDVLCVGGGIVGLMAAIRAKETGAKVIIVEKGNTLRSGAGACGNDHFQCYIPEVHGLDFEAFLEELAFDQNFILTGIGDREYLRTWLLNSFEIVKLWDSWGIPMKFQGKWEFAGHTYPGRISRHLKYSGQNQKLILTNEALRRGVQIINRVMIFDLIKNENGIVGAIGIDTREDRIVGFKAKSIILGTGSCLRLYPGPTPSWMSNLTYPFNLTGDGRAMAYRVGAELFNLELPSRHAGPKYFSRSGQATWIGLLKDPNGKIIGPFLKKPDRRYGEMTIEMYKRVFDDYMKSGKGPIYMDCTDVSEEDLEYMKYWLQHEGNTSLLNYMAEEGIDLRKNPVEFMTYEMRVRGGIYTNHKAQTSIKGLYSAGDESFFGISGAAVFGWIAGENAASFTKQTELSDNIDLNTLMGEKEKFFIEIKNRQDGPDWKEVNIALQQIMYDYAGLVRSETLLTAGRVYIQRLKEKTKKSIMARNQHELMRCIEIFNLLDLGEAVFISANERKESRGLHVRTDYPFINPLYNRKILLIKKLNNEICTEWREIK